MTITFEKIRGGVMRVDLERQFQLKETWKKEIGGTLHR